MKNINHAFDNLADQFAALAKSFSDELDGAETEDDRTRIAVAVAKAAEVLDRRYPFFDRWQFLADCGL